MISQESSLQDRNWQDISDDAEWQLQEELTAELGGRAIEQFCNCVSWGPARVRGSTPNYPIPQLRNFKSDYNSCMLGYAVSAISATAALAVAGGYQSMAPTGQWYGKTFTGLPRGSRQMALTYDDGPNDSHTLLLLEVLAKHGVQATFFLIGRYVKERPEIVREIVHSGHIVGNHTFTHPLLTFKNEAEIRQELEQCRSALQDAVGLTSNLFRPPFGGRRPAVLRIARELGLEPVMWNVTGYDWNSPPAAEIEHKIARQIRGDDVILLHDGGHKQMGTDRSQTIIATDRLIARYRNEGYGFVTIPQMMQQRENSVG